MLRSLMTLTAAALLAALPLARPAAAEDLKAAPSAAMSAAANAFARDLYGRLSDGDGNVFFSAYSVHAALLLGREGARGETREQMDKVLRLGGIEPGAGYLALRTALRAPEVTDYTAKPRAKVPAYLLEVANAMWGQHGYAFEQPYLDRLAKVYGAPLERIDFGDGPAARKRINDWVAQHTHDKIKDIVPEGMPHPLTRMALANAIYLKAPWADPFLVRGTKEGDFTGVDGTKSKAKLMNRMGGYPYAEVGDTQILELPYRGRRLSMIVYLPKTHDGLGAVEKQLRRGDLDVARTSRLVDVKLPKWKFTSTFDLTPVLPAMGMPLAFDPLKADFSGLTKTEKTHIGLVLHKAFVAVDEAGTEAAAATVMMWKGGEARPQEPRAFHADRPFLFEIRHTTTGAILFAGRVTRP